MISQTFIAHSCKLRQEGLYRQRILGDDSKINFSSNDYLSLTEDQRVKLAFQRGFAKYPAGSGGSMVICGYHPIHKELEQVFSQALDADDALLFSSGYAANLGVISLLAKFAAHLFIDKTAHASLYDGLRLTDANYSRFLHNDLQNLAGKLQSHPHNPVVITESVFSMSGQATNLHELMRLCTAYEVDCIVDEAHAFGVFGPQGLGAVVQYGLTQKEIPLRIIPFGKAFAAQGAIVVGRKEWLDMLLQTARSQIYSTALSPAFAHGLLETFSIIREADDRRQKLYQLIAYFQQACNNSPLSWRNSQTPIQQLQLGCPHKALAYATFLRNRGIFCQAIRAPTVNKKETGLRVILNYRHEPEHLDHLFAQLHQLYESTS
jgi:8-amino-7-oxononanoate synthase